MTDFRLPTGGVIDRTAPIRFRFNDTDYTGFRGDTLASALLANGVRDVATSIKFGRPRGITGSWTEDSTAQVAITAPYSEPMIPATTVDLCEGLHAHGVQGLGVAKPEPEQTRYDAKHLHTDVLVIGGGPAGLAAAVSAAQSGADVALIDDRPELGGADPSIVDPALLGAVESLPNLTILTRTTAFGAYDDGFVLAVQRRTDHLGAPVPDRSRQRIWRIRAADTVVTTGAIPRPIVFAHNDLPGVMLAAAALDFAARYAVRVGSTAVMFTANDEGHQIADALVDYGITIAAIVDPRAAVSPELLAQAQARSIPVHVGSWVHTAVAAPGPRPWVVGAVVGPAIGPTTTVDADTILTHGGRTPTAHLLTHRPGQPRSVPISDDAAVWRTPVGDESRSFVDLQRDATVADIRRAIDAGMRSAEHVKRFTTIGTAHDQGRTSGLIASGIIAELLGEPVESVGLTTSRPPQVPITFAALAGRNRGSLFDPERITTIHQWHVAHDAVFEDVGQWKRARYYPIAAEDMDAAVSRECAAVRESVGILDGSTLGKIDVQGRDAPEFLDRIYTNMMSSLGVDMVRYGVMCSADGMVFDDGTVMRLGDEHFVLYTTTGGAAKVLDWLEEWLQTEWPDLAVVLTSVTEQWATFPVVGPHSRDVIAAVFPDVAVSAADFGFMAVRHSSFAGVPVRLARVSFSGELAFEVNIAGTHALPLWEALISAGREFGITAYGTETMHVLRAEKGYPIVGQDTDGTVSPHDLGMQWVVSKKKPDFIGKRSFSRAANLSPLRKQLVGLLPTDSATVLPEGSQIIEFHNGATLPPPPVPMLGHVTSSYRSAALARPFALALLTAGRSRIGDRLHVPVGDTLVEVEVTGSVLYDPEGARRDG